MADAIPTISCAHCGKPELTMSELLISCGPDGGIVRAPACWDCMMGGRNALRRQVERNAYVTEHTVRIVEQMLEAEKAGAQC